ncbi:hypothetical protein D9M70_507410 [compost metagenome]
MKPFSVSFRPIYRCVVLDKYEIPIDSMHGQECNPTHKYRYDPGTPACKNVAPLINHDPEQNAENHEVAKQPKRVFQLTMNKHTSQCTRAEGPRVILASTPQHINH